MPDIEGEWMDFEGDLRHEIQESFLSKSDKSKALIKVRKAHKVVNDIFDDMGRAEDDVQRRAFMRRR